MIVTSGQIKRFKVGQITATGATEATLTVPNLEADSMVVLSLNTVAGTPAAPYIVTKTAGKSGTLGIKSGASDTSVYDVFVFN